MFKLGERGGLYLLYAIAGFGRVELGFGRCVYFLTVAFGNYHSHTGSERVIQLYDRQPIFRPGPFFLSVPVASFKDLIRLEDKNSNRWQSLAVILCFSLTLLTYVLHSLLVTAVVGPAFWLCLLVFHSVLIQLSTNRFNIPQYTARRYTTTQHNTVKQHKIEEGWLSSPVWVLFFQLLYSSYLRFKKAPDGRLCKSLSVPPRLILNWLTALYRQCLSDCVRVTQVCTFSLWYDLTKHSLVCLFACVSI